MFGASSGDNQPIDKVGLLNISRGIVLAGGSPVLGGVQANTTQTEGVYVKHIDVGSKIDIYEENTNKIIINIKAPKAVEYLYFSFPEKNFYMQLNGAKVKTNSTSIFKGLQSDPSQNLVDDSNNSFFIGKSNIFILLVFILF